MTPPSENYTTCPPCQTPPPPDIESLLKNPNIILIIGTMGSLLVISLCLNVYVCASKFCSGKRGQKQRRSPTQMEENPIYGNISYIEETTNTQYTQGDRPLSTLSSSSTREKHRDRSKTQDCYANLALKPPRLQSGRSSPQIQYSDVVQFEVQLEAETQNEGDSEAAAAAPASPSALSDLYASVPSQRVKVNTADTGEDYANHLCPDTGDDLP